MKALSMCKLVLLTWTLVLNPAKAAEAGQVFDDFWQTMHRHYALFEVKNVDWDRLYTIHRKQVSSDSSDDELFATISRMAGFLNDLHVTINDPQGGRFFRSGGRSIATGDFDAGEFSIDLIRNRYLQHDWQARGLDSIHYGRLADNIGYIHFAAFRFPASSEQAIDEFIEVLGDARGIIIDVRQNGGGSDRIGKLIADRFVGKRRTYMSVADRIPGSSPARFREAVQWQLEPDGPAQFTRPVVVLTNSRSVSAAENFTLAMRTVPHATIIGETTAGVMADIKNHRLRNGWQLTIPANVMRDVNGVCWEGVGIAPDLWIRNSVTDIADGRDRVLEFALSYLAQSTEQNRSADGVNQPRRSPEETSYRRAQINGTG